MGMSPVSGGGLPLHLSESPNGRQRHSTMLLFSPQSLGIELGTRETSLVLKMDGHQKLGRGEAGSHYSPQLLPPSSCEYETLGPPEVDGGMQAHGAPSLVLYLLPCGSSATLLRLEDYGWKKPPGTPTSPPHTLSTPSLGCQGEGLPLSVLS